MIHQFQGEQFKAYTEARAHFIENYQKLIDLEKELTNALFGILKANIEEIKRDYNEASYLYPFWKNYPPEDRGRQPIKDQYPWIEVGEHAIGSKLPRLLERYFGIRDTGLPTGADQRFVLTHDKIRAATGGFTNAAWMFVDIKSVGPRDDQDHTVMSHNQVSGDGIWNTPEEGVKNSILEAVGARASHDFHASLPPIFVLSDGVVAPLVMIALKPVYKMLGAAKNGDRNGGQPLERVDIACIPNGLLLTQNPNYLKSHRGLLFPGKDDKTKDPRKLRARVSFELLKRLGQWRVQTLMMT